MIWRRGERIRVGRPSRRLLGRTAGLVLAASVLFAGVARARGVGPEGDEDASGPRAGAWTATAAASASSGAALTARVRDPAPEPYLGPDDVVEIMLRALQHNDDPVVDHGIAVTFAFTSPENHDVTGPLRRFRTIVKSSAYRPMIDHARADRGPVLLVAEHARQRVAITGAHGEHAVYVFLLSRQESGAYKGCWMADGVLRETDPLLERRDPALTRAVVEQD